jgi:nucleotide-binding universal stress UspA family protein
VRTLVVGVDGSERSRDALALARCLAQTATQLVLVCAYAADRYRAGDGGASYGRALRADAEAALARLGGGIGSETIAIADHHPARALEEIAARLQASLIVIGSTHRGRWQRVLPGGTGEHLLEEAQRPIAIAPRGFCERDHEQLRSVACAFDGAPESRRALAYAAELAGGVGARLAVVRATDPPGAVDATLALDELGAAAAHRLRVRPMEELRRVVAELDPALEADATLLYGDPAAELVRMSVVVDLLVLGSRGLGPVRGVLLGSVSARVIRDSACPVIVVPHNARLQPATPPVAILGAKRARV